MVFGIDGVLLKDSEIRVKKNEEENPEAKNFEGARIKSSCRVYTARTIGRTEIYALQRQTLEGLFDITDLLSTHNFPR